MKLFAFTALLAIAATAANAANTAWVRQDRSSGAKIVPFSVALPERNLDQLDQIFNEVTDPESPKYGQYKTPEEINRLTASSPETLKHTWNYFERNGAKCKAFWSHLECAASVQDVERMFAAKMHDHTHKASGAVISRVVGQYQFPEELQGHVEFVSGLTQLPVPRFGRTRTVGGSDYVTVPSTLKSLYNIQATGSSKVSQGAAEFQGYPAVKDSDLKTFIQKTGIPAFDLTNKIGPFRPTYPGAESTLDVQYLGAVGSGNDNWYWTEEQWMFDFTNSVLKRSRSQIPDVISMSYGWSEVAQCQISPSSQPCEQGGSVNFVQRVNSNFQKIGAMGVSVLASSGDSGAHGRTDRTCSSDAVHPTFPAACPYLTAVGATMFEAGSVKYGGNAPICNRVNCASGGTEVVCTTRNSAALITSGGGFSTIAARPKYQDSAVQGYLNKAGVLPPSGAFNSSGRGYPDVAAFGHAYYIELDGQVQQVDGTSASCPVFAGVVGLLNAYRVENGKPKIGFANPLLYKMQAQFPQAFNDVTSGDNKCTEVKCCNSGFSASQGWDATTGLGTPNVAEMLKALQQMDNLNAPSDSLLASAKSLRGMFQQSA